MCMQLRSECMVFAFCTTRDYGDSCCSIKMPNDCTMIMRSSDDLQCHLLLIHSTESLIIMRMDGNDDTLCAWTTTQMPRGSCWPPLRQTGEDNWVVPASHGSAPSDRIWNITILRSPKQQIWLRTALCGGWCRRMALRNRELHARNDDDDDRISP